MPSKLVNHPPLTLQNNQTTPNAILNLLINLENNGYSKFTIESTDQILRRISQHADINNPEEVKRYISKNISTNGYRRHMVIVYARYCKYYKIHWEKPRYRIPQHHIKIPTKEKLEMLIANAGRVMALKLTISMETGLRPIEVVNLKVKDIDLEQKTIRPTTAKNGQARTLKISTKLQLMLSDYITRRQLNLNDRLFNITSRTYGKMYAVTRRRLANKLKDPTLLTIRLYDFRHYFATMLYHKTRDIILVKQKLGHRCIENTLVYTQLLDTTEEDEYTCKTADNIKEAQQLIETGFEYVTEMDGTKLFKKRK
jgi:integrase